MDRKSKAQLVKFIAAETGKIGNILEGVGKLRNNLIEQVADGGECCEATALCLSAMSKLIAASADLFLLTKTITELPEFLDRKESLN